MEIFEIRKGKSTPEFIGQPDCQVFLKEMSFSLHGSCHYVGSSPRYVGGSGITIPAET
jgi:hypothetical protein